MPLGAFLPITLNLQPPASPTPGGFGGMHLLFNQNLDLSPINPLTIREAIVAALLADSPTVALFGQNIFPIAIKEGTLPPALTYQFIDLDPVHNLSGQSGLNMGKIVFVGRSHSLADTVAATKALRNLLASFKGLLSGIQIRGVFKRREEDGYDYPDDNSDNGTYSTLLDYDVWYRESVPPNQTGN